MASKLFRRVFSLLLLATVAAGMDTDRVKKAIIPPPGALAYGYNYGYGYPYAADPYYRTAGWYPTDDGKYHPGAYDDGKYHPGKYGTFDDGKYYAGTYDKAGKPYGGWYGGYKGFGGGPFYYYPPYGYYGGSRF